MKRRTRRLLSLLLAVVMIATTFMTNNMITKATMLPIEEVKAYLMLYQYENEVDYSKVSLQFILDHLVKKNNEKINVNTSDGDMVWEYVKDSEDGIEYYNEYKIIDNPVLDLTSPEGISNYTKELIVGKDGPLNANNIRYSIDVYVSDTSSYLIEYELYKQDEDGNRTKVEPADVINAETRTFIVPDHQVGDEYYLGMKMDCIRPDIDVEVRVVSSSNYNGDVITEQVLNKDMSKKDMGYKSTYDSLDQLSSSDYFKNLKFFKIIFRDPENPDNIYGENNTKINVTNDRSFVNCELYQRGDDEKKNPVLWESNDAVLEQFGNEEKVLAPVYRKSFMVNQDIDVRDDFYIVMDAHGEAWKDEDANSYVVKAVEGKYNAISSTSLLVDIKETLIPEKNKKDNIEDGYKISFDSEEEHKYFTIFFKKVGNESDETFDDSNTKAWIIDVSIRKYDPQFDMNYIKEYTAAPIIGQKDPWFRTVGVEDKKGNTYENKVYIVENGNRYNMDTYYGYGYQTLFINNSDIDLSELKPKFEFANSNRLYAITDTNDLVNQNHVRNFDEVNQQYSVIFDNDNSKTRNYWITFKKLSNNGSELYVYGPKDREVLLNDYFEYKHDILIANIGNEPLKNIKAELINAKNVKLDQYWSVNSSTLAPLTTTEKSTEYGELSNITKIRLISDGDGKVQGVLKITADGQQPVEISLNGTAKIPEINTVKLKDAVKYVPYQQIISTDNIHDNIRTEFKISEGSLPTGIELNKSTGELYGVPQDVGEYKFKIKATFYVENSQIGERESQELTIKVNDNTNKNVFDSSDYDDPEHDYKIKQSIGIEDGDGTHNYLLNTEDIPNEGVVFTSYGDYSEFKTDNNEEMQGKVWLNGEELKQDEDYDSESGSTKITIKKKTFDEKTRKNDKNTIAIEFRKRDESSKESKSDMRKTAQNFRLVEKKPVEDNSDIENVHKLIDKIPSEINIDAESSINAAQKAYENLPENRKSLVDEGRLNKLTNAINTLENDKKDREAATKVANMISAINMPITIELEAKINSAREEYNLLTAKQKEYVGNINDLNSYETQLQDIKKEMAEKEKINEVISAIENLPEDIKLTDKENVKSVREKFDVLDNNQQQKVVNYEKLQAAENTIRSLEERENADSQDIEAANAVINRINTITSDISLSDKDNIQNIRDEYEKLSDNQKILVSNYNKLTDAENTIKRLEDYEKASQNDKNEADKVIKLINEIPENITEETKASIQNVREEYDKLSEKQKSIITNYKKLTDAEVKLAQLEHANYNVRGSVTFAGILVDNSGNEMVDQYVEIHSEVKKARTDKQGMVQFNSVEFGNHTIYVKDNGGNVVAQKEFSIENGAQLSLTGDLIVAENNSEFTVNMKVEGNKIEFLSIQNGIDKQHSENASNQNNKKSDNPQKAVRTGDGNMIKIWNLILLASVLAVTEMCIIKKKEAK